MRVLLGPRIRPGSVRPAVFGNSAGDPPPEFPAWRQGQAVGEWREIANSSLSSVAPTHNPNNKPLVWRIAPWCGLAVDTTRNVVWSLANGGHNDYHGNEVYRLDLSQNAPVWQEWFPSDPTLPTQYDAARYPSGRPASCHTYYSQHYIPFRDRVVRFGALAVATSGNSFRVLDGWIPTVAQGESGWEDPSTYPDIPALGTIPPPTCCDPDTGDVYLFRANYEVLRWSRASNTWQGVNNGFPPAVFEDRPCAYDTARDRILVFSRPDNFAYTFDPATGQFTLRTLSGSDASAISGSSSGAGMVYVPAIDTYLYRRGAAGGAVYAINPATFEVTQLSTTGGSGVPATDTISGNPENVYTKWLYVPAYGGIFYYPRHSANCWFLRVH